MPTLVDSFTRGVANTPMDITLPATKAVGQLCIIPIVFNPGSGWVAGTPSGPAGWNLLEPIEENGALIAACCFWKVLEQADIDATTIDISWSAGVGNPSTVGTLWTDFDENDPIGAFEQHLNASASSIATSSITAEADGSALLVAAGTASESVQVTNHNYSAYPELTEVAEQATGGGTGTWRRASVAYDSSISSGATTAYSVGMTGGPAVSAAWQIEIRPAASTPTADYAVAGALTDDGFTARAKVANASSVRLVVSTASDLSSPAFSSAVTPDAQGYVKATVSGLSANTQYYYGWELDSTVVADARGIAKTLPADGQAASFAFAASSCATTGSNDSIFATIQGDAPLFFLHMGDFHYEDIATTVEADHRAPYELQLGQSNQAALYADVPLVYMWSDHDYCGNNTDGTAAGKTAAQNVYRQLFPAYTMPDEGTTGALWQTFRVGRVEFFVWDTRSERSPIANTDDTSKTMLGSSQKTAWKNWLSANPDAAKITVCDVPWHDDELVADAWGRYTTERDELTAYLAANAIENLVIIAGDMHSVAFDSGDDTPGNIPCIQASPLHQSSSHKGGPWDKGPNPTTEGVIDTHRYGLLSVTDSGGNDITLVFSARDGSGTTVLTDSTVTFTNVEGAPTTTETLRPDAILEQFNDNKLLSALQQDVT